MALNIKLGTDYEVAQDAGVWHNGRLLTGVWLSTDGEAWAGLVKADTVGAYVDLADADGDFIPASQNWDACIVREIPPISTAGRLWSAA